MRHWGRNLVFPYEMTTTSDKVELTLDKIINETKKNAFIAN